MQFTVLLHGGTRTELFKAGDGEAAAAERRYTPAPRTPARPSVCACSVSSQRAALSAVGKCTLSAVGKCSACQVQCLSAAGALLLACLL